MPFEIVQRHAAIVPGLRYGRIDLQRPGEPIDGLGGPLQFLLDEAVIVERRVGAGVDLQGTSDEIFGLLRAIRLLQNKAQEVERADVSRLTLKCATKAGLRRLGVSVLHGLEAAPKRLLYGRHGEMHPCRFTAYRPRARTSRRRRAFRSCAAAQASAVQTAAESARRTQWRRAAPRRQAVFRYGSAVMRRAEPPPSAPRQIAQRRARSRPAPTCPRRISAPRRSQ